MFSDLDVYNLKEGDTLTLDHDVRLHMDTVTEGKYLRLTKELLGFILKEFTENWQED